MIIIITGHVIIHQVEDRQKLERQQTTMQLIANTANTLDQQLSMSLSATKALGALIQEYGDIPDFDSLAKQMLEVYGGLVLYSWRLVVLSKSAIPLKETNQL